MADNNIVEVAYDSGVKAVQDISDTLFALKSVENLKLLRIGKPSGFSRAVDPDARIQWHMESKMNVIDLIPCSYMIPLTKAKEAVTQKGENTDIVDTLSPHLSYGQAVKEFQEITTAYGLGAEYGGLRLFLTDETTSTDDFTNTYTDNWLSSIFNSLVDKTKTMREIGRSVSSNYDQAARKYGAEYGGKIGEKGGDIIETLSRADVGLGGKLKQLGSAVGAAVAAGDRITMPKLWSDSNYSPNISAVVKLVSPYGHPDAIKEFIIKPLMFLLIMASPRTRDGISYGHTPKVTVKGYGIAHLPLAHISNINLRKGGADTSFNIYRQPLSIDVSLQFESLVSGFAVFTEQNKMSETHENFYKDTNKITLDINSARAGKKAFFPTLGTIVDSIRPVAINNIVTRYNPHDLPKHPGISRASSDQLARISEKNTWSRKPDKVGNETSLLAASEENTNKQASETVTGQYTATNVEWNKLLEDQERIRNQRRGIA